MNAYTPAEVPATDHPEAVDDENEDDSGGAPDAA
jgi:hypothetical protein